MTGSSRPLIIGAIAAAMIVVASVIVWVLVPSSVVAGVAVASYEPSVSTANCDYSRVTDAPTANFVGLPADAARTPASGKVQVTLKTSQGDIPMTLDREQAPCTVGSLLHLAEKKYFDGTACHRITVFTEFKVLQCGDPTGSGGAGPGYEFDDELPTGLRAAGDGKVIYPKGTVAMANAGPDTNGSQFFLVYADTPLAPNYPVFGTYDSTGQTTIDKVAAGGVAPDSETQGDGKPAIPITIEKVTVGR